MKRKHRKGFTLIELSVVIGIIVLLAGAGLVSYKALLDKTRKIACRTNLRAINLALNMYLHDYGVFPSTESNLVDLLAPYNVSPRMFHCPDDPVKDRNTYALFYVQRETRPDEFAYVIGCPFHSRGEESVALLYGYDPQDLKNLKVTLNGTELDKGEILALKSGDVLRYYLEDGTPYATVNVVSNIDSASVLASFKLPGDKPYGILKINDVGEVDVSVQSGSRFEVVTPSTIAGVQGTRFGVNVSTDNNYYTTTIDVQEGVVTAVILPNTVEAFKNNSLVRGRKIILRAGDQGVLKRALPGYLPHRIEIEPSYVVLKRGERVEFEVKGYDRQGRRISLDGYYIEWTLRPLLWPCGRLRPTDDGEEAYYTAHTRGYDRVIVKVGPRKAKATVVVE